jgi:hypothetical protein
VSECPNTGLRGGLDGNPGEVIARELQIRMVEHIEKPSFDKINRPVLQGWWTVEEKGVMERDAPSAVTTKRAPNQRRLTERQRWLRKLNHRQGRRGNPLRSS